MKKILVLFDPIPAAMHAYRFALDIAATNKGEIVALKVADVIADCSENLDDTCYSINSIASPLLVKKQAQSDFEQLMRRCGTKVPVFFEVDQGAISHTVLKAIHRHQADLIVVGASATDGLGELLPDSNLVRILNSSPVPVFVIYSPQKIANIRNIIFPTTIGSDQGIILEKITGLQQLFRAQLHLLYIKTRFTKQTDQQLEESLERFAQFYALDNYRIHIGHESSLPPGFKLASRLGNSIIATVPARLTGQSYPIQKSGAEILADYN